MSSISPCSDVSDMTELNKSFGLYLKPICRSSITLLLPASLAKQSISISNWDVQEKLHQVAKPVEFDSIKAVKTTLDTLKFEVELTNRKDLKRLIKQMTSVGSIKIQGWPEPARLQCCEAKIPHPVKHDWQSFFRDAKGLDEMKPGQRPDTLYVKGLPIRWFRDEETPTENPQPSLTKVHQVFKAFGDVRIVNIPMLDELNMESHEGGSAFGKMSASELVFDAYIQYREYVGFVKAMDSLRAQKLVYKPGDASSKDSMYSANIVVDFDRTQHLSEAKIQRRALELRRAREIASRKKRENLKRKMQEEREALKAAHRESNKRNVQDEARRLCRNLIDLVAKDVEGERKRKDKKKTEPPEKPHDLLKIQAEHRKELLLVQEQLLRERLLRRLQEKKLRSSSSNNR
ncbi:A-kinase anchor protein 17A [Galendromus occidentalis]|uniref:A-kinase anchor protein 17A n=1 Tax=Galendromus occidentalis TaxID=34638 RepID=A0AAJ6VZ18_9ACAR|nr:A-kinase anchor protein 17A [Galendromus occidentalis]